MPLELTPWSRVIFDKLIVTQLVSKFPAFYVYKSPPLVPILSHMNPVHILPPYFPKIHSNIFHLLLGLPNGLLPSGFPTNILRAFLIYFMRAAGLAHIILHDKITQIISGEAYKSWSSSLQSFPPSCHSLLGPNILLSTLFSDTLNAYSSISVRDQVSHPYETRSEIMVLYILIFKFLGRRQEDKIFWTGW